jgi:hypothetical protein
LVAFSLRNGVVPPSGQLMTSAPLSVEYMTMVLSAMPRSSSSLRSWPTLRLTGRRRAKRDGNRTATPFGAPVEPLVRRPPAKHYCP